MLCENCQQSALRDDLPAFRVEINRFGHRSVVTDEDSTIPTNYFLLDHLPKLPQLRESALSGCELCSFLRESILSRDTAEFLQDEHELEITRLQEEEITLQIRYRWNCTVDDTNDIRHYLQVIVKFTETNLEFFISCVIGAAEKDDPVAKWLHLDNPSTRALNSPKIIRWIKECIQDCKEHYHELPTPEFVPKLLLDVRGKIPKLTDQDTLTSTRKTRGQLKVQTPRYAALSYCWGTAEDAKAQITTTLSSFSERQAGIETHDITPVLQDAITITKQLSIPYLWIDSLCVFQDDIADWNRQCMDMDKIYGHAEITILAASSTSCREGFIKRKVPQIRLPFHSALNQALQGSMWIELQQVGPSSAPFLSGIFGDYSNNRLARRGWAFQERFLSTRQIIFGKSSAHFICPEEHQSHGRPLSLDRYTRNIQFTRVTRDVQELYDEWDSILNGFSSMNDDSFTCATDLLPSISGIAADFAKRLKDDYFAGHWGNDLVMSLMWTRDGDLQVSKSEYFDRVCSPTQYLVPSWSRLSPSNKTSNFRSHMTLFHPAVESIGARTVKHGSNEFGAIKNGDLRVRSYCMSIPATNVIQLKSIKPSGRGTKYRSDQIIQWYMTFQQYDNEDLFCYVYLDYDLAVTEIHEEVKLWKWILLGTCQARPYDLSRRTKQHEEDMYPFGLLVHGTKHSEWCRVGVFGPAFQGPRLSLQIFQMASTLEDITVI